MNNAKRILFTISGILSILGILLWLSIGIVFVALANNAEFVERLADESSSGTSAEFFQVYFTSLGVMFIVFAVMCVINTIMCFKGRNSDSKKVMILNIVFGVLSSIGLNILAAIFGLIARNKKPKETTE